MDYHLEYLANPESHGIRIEKFTASDGTPCLVCVPEGNPGRRGTIIRTQLGERDVPLPAFGGIQGTLVLVHGRKGRKEDYLPIAERLCAAGFRCIIPDLPAHGDHPHDIATYGVREAALPARVLDEASMLFKFDPEPAGLIGMSMGGSVAMHAMSEPEAPWKALVIISSFDSFPTVIKNQATRYSGVLGPLCGNAIGGLYRWKTDVDLTEIQPHRHAADVKVPTLVAHGSDDRVIEMATGCRLFRSLPEDTVKSWIEVPGADHDNVLITDFPIYAEIAHWMIQHVPKS
jgi:alpha-beta hydrolase superfamily lysophospholipase